MKIIIYKLLHIPTSQFVNFGSSEWHSNISTKNPRFYNKNKDCLDSFLLDEEVYTIREDVRIPLLIWYGLALKIKGFFDENSDEVCIFPIWTDKEIGEKFIKRFDIFLNEDVIAEDEFSIEEEIIDLTDFD